MEAVWQLEIMSVFPYFGVGGFLAERQSLSRQGGSFARLGWVGAWVGVIASRDMRFVQGQHLFPASVVGPRK